jgi:hypothetical protein
MFLVYSLFALATNVKIYQKINELQCSNDVSRCSLLTISGGSKVLYFDQSGEANDFSNVQAWIGVIFVLLWGMLYMIKTYF